MSLGTRKLIVIGVIGCVFLAANVMVIAIWLNEQGIPGRADWIRKEFLTGTAITVILALLVLLVNPKEAGRGAGWGKRCPVCDGMLNGKAKMAKRTIAGSAGVRYKCRKIPLFSNVNSRMHTCLARRGYRRNPMGVCQYAKVN